MNSKKMVVIVEHLHQSADFSPIGNSVIRHKEYPQMLSTCFRQRWSKYPLENVQINHKQD